MEVVLVLTSPVVPPAVETAAYLILIWYVLKGLGAAIVCGISMPPAMRYDGHGIVRTAAATMIVIFATFVAWPLAESLLFHIHAIEKE